MGFGAALDFYFVTYLLGKVISVSEPWFLLL